jgi:cytidylate kinase
MPVITISRMFGSGGSEVARARGRRTRLDAADNALVERVATRLGRTPVEVQAIEERGALLAERLADALALGSPRSSRRRSRHPLPPTEERLLEVTEHVIDDAIARGPVVLVGRGAQAYLAQRADALHVFCYASRPALIARVVEREDCGRGSRKARGRDEQAPQQYVRRYWHRSWHAPENYHLCVNTEWLGIDGAADLIVQVAEGLA